MTTTTARRVRSGLVPSAALAVLAVLATGCGTHRAGHGAPANGPSGTTAATPGKPVDFRCPREDPGPTPSATASDPATPPTDHYAENHGFMVPIALHGQARCDGLAAVRRIRQALEPLRRRGDFDPAGTREALVRLGYSSDSVRAHQSGATGVGFLVDAHSMCLEGTLNSAGTEVDAFGGYPDGTACEPPSGGH
ncbi:hypothetical protein [Streptomyces sp. NPDC086787]|uniref:hypothetical protein n=1 Tax=Streptomyces sp. NPDC086787 TaxID=3365759 RepID=UPI00380E7E44